MGMGIRRSVVAVALALMTFAGANEAAHATTPSTRWHGSLVGPIASPKGTDAEGSWPMRNYYVYVPQNLPPVGQRSVVVYLHGTTQTAIDAANGVLWNDLADREGFIVAYPEEATPAESGDSLDGSSDGRGWAWGQAAEFTRGSGEMRTIANITQAVVSDYGINAGRVYIGGASAGAIMSTVMAATYPDLYSAVGSWAGCNYLCADPSGALGYQRMGTYARVVPTIAFMGTADYVVNPALGATQITGLLNMSDLADDGLPNNSVAHKPTFGPKNYNLDVATVAPRDLVLTDNGCHNTQPNTGCPGGWLGWTRYPHTITRFGFATHKRDVVLESWIIHGMAHSYSGGNPEGSYVDALGPDTTTPAWNFFRAHARS